MKYISVLIFTIISISSYSQKIKILDKQTKSPIENVHVKYKSSYKISNSLGEIKFKNISSGDSLIFKHSSYKEKKTTYSKIKDNNTVYLRTNVFDLDEIIINANKWEQKKSEIPNKISTISAREIEISNPQTSADLLNASNEVFIQKSQLGGGSPMIRGFATNRLLLVVDGVRMNNAIFRSGNLQNVISLDAQSIESSEIIFGPGSVIYGSDALGGVMDFHTLEPELASEGNSLINANVLSRFSSANMEKTGHIDLNIANDNFSFLVSYTANDFENLKMGDNGNDEYKRYNYQDRINNTDTILNNDNPLIQKFSGYDQKNILSKIRYKPYEQLDLSYGIYYSETSDIPRYDRLIQEKDGELKYAKWYYGPQTWMMNRLTVSYSDTSAFFDNLKLIAALQNYEESRHDRKFDSNTLRNRTENVDAYSLNIDFDKEINDKIYLFYGLEAVENFVSSKGYEENIDDGEYTEIASRYPDGSDWNSYAAYFNIKYKLNKKISVLGGIRYNQVIINAKFDTTFYNFPFTEATINTGSTNGSLGLVYRPNTSLQFNLNASTGFRAPNIDDMGKVFDSEPGKVIVPNPDLKAEYAYNLDFGIIKTINNRLKIDITGFYTILDNAMARRDYSFNGLDSIIYDGVKSKVQAVQNVDKAYIYGFNAGLIFRIIDKLKIKTAYNYTKGKEISTEDNTEYPIRHVAPSFGTTHLIYSYKKLHIDFYSNYNSEISYDNLALSERDKTHMYASDKNGNLYSPAWYTLNIKAVYNVIKFLKISAGIENITDECYRPYSSGIVAPGRNFIISAKASF